jgi:hypothetical protein
VSCALIAVWRNRLLFKKIPIFFVFLFGSCPASRDEPRRRVGSDGAAGAGLPPPTGAGAGFAATATVVAASNAGVAAMAVPTGRLLKPGAPPKPGAGRSVLPPPAPSAAVSGASVPVQDASGTNVAVASGAALPAGTEIG